jgi:hypothetical protein
MTSDHQQVSQFRTHESRDFGHLKMMENASGKKGPNIGFCMNNRVLGNASQILNEITKS